MFLLQPGVIFILPQPGLFSPFEQDYLEFSAMRTVLGRPLVQIVFQKFEKIDWFITQ